MNKILVCLFLFALTASSISAEPPIEFHVANQFTIAALDSISEVVYNDIDGDGIVEALVRSGQDVVLYSISREKVVWEKTLPISSFYKVLLADVNRDSKVDMVTATYGGLGTFSSTGVEVTLYNGICDKDPIQVHYPNREETCPFYDGMSSCGWSHYLGLTALTAGDYNGDGYNEMLLSYGHKRSWADGLVYVGRTWALGSTRMYHHFPDSLAWMTDKTTFPGGVIEIDQETIPVLKCKCYYSDIGERGLDGMGRHNGQQIALLAISGLNPDGSQTFGLTSGNGECKLNSIDSQCDSRFRDTHTSSNHKLLPVLIGDIDPGNPGYEILVDHKWANICDYEFSSYNPPEYGHTLSLYYLSDNETLVRLWERELDYDSDYLFVDAAVAPGNFFGLKEDSLFVFSGTSGELVSSQDGLPTGLSKFDPAQDWFDVNVHLIDGNQITWYEVATPTAVEETGDESELLPSSLAISAPYPNPFNAQLTIPVTTRPGTRLTVEVIDLLGRKVERIFDETTRVPLTSVIWKADGSSSGVYLVRATTSGGAVTAKALLLK